MIDFPASAPQSQAKITSGWRINWMQNLTRCGAVRTASCQQTQQLLKSEHAIIGTHAQERPGISAAQDCDCRSSKCGCLCESIA